MKLYFSAYAAEDFGTGVQEYMEEHEGNDIFLTNSVLLLNGADLPTGDTLMLPTIVDRTEGIVILAFPGAILPTTEIPN